MTRIKALTGDFREVARRIDNFTALVRVVETSKPGVPKGNEAPRSRPFRLEVEDWGKELDRLVADLNEHHKALNALAEKFKRFSAARMSARELNAITSVIRAHESERNRLQQATILLDSMYRDLGAMRRIAPR